MSTRLGLSLNLHAGNLPLKANVSSGSENRRGAGERRERRDW